MESTPAWLQLRYEALAKAIKAVQENISIELTIPTHTQLPKNTSKHEWYNQWANMVADLCKDYSFVPATTILFISPEALTAFIFSEQFIHANSIVCSGAYFAGTLAEYTVVVDPAATAGTIIVYDVLTKLAFKILEDKDESSR